MQDGIRFFVGKTNDDSEAGLGTGRFRHTGRKRESIQQGGDIIGPRTQRQQTFGRDAIPRESASPSSVLTVGEPQRGENHATGRD